MDHMVELQARNGGGGCTAITILFLNGNLYAAGAGDSRFDKIFYPFRISVKKKPKGLKWFLTSGSIYFSGLC